MAHLSGIFLNPSAGRLRVTLTGVFSTSGGDRTFPYSGSGDLALRASIGGNYTNVINQAQQLAYLELDYPGGSVAWQFFTETVASQPPSGTSSVGFRNLQLILNLQKR